MDVTILIFTVLGALFCGVTVLPLLGIDIRIFGKSEMAAELSPSSNRKSKRVWLALAASILSFGISCFAAYYFFRPRTIEKIVEKPVDRVVEKIVPAQCPKVDCPKAPMRTSNAGPAPPAIKQSLVDNEGGKIGQISQSGTTTMIADGTTTQNQNGVQFGPGANVATFAAKDVDICFGNDWLCFVKNERNNVNDHDMDAFEKRIAYINELVDLRTKMKPDQSEQCHREVDAGVQLLRDHIDDEASAIKKLLNKDSIPICFKPQ